MNRDKVKNRMRGANAFSYVPFVDRKADEVPSIALSPHIQKLLQPSTHLDSNNFGVGVAFRKEREREKERDKDREKDREKDRDREKEKDRRVDSTVIATSATTSSAGGSGSGSGSGSHNLSPPPRR